MRGSQGQFPAYDYMTHLKNVEMAGRECERNRNICVGRKQLQNGRGVKHTKG